ncbi:MAG TPA: glycoside hydrolase family protein, partial [Candidatus Eremiobacteraceae bacterium]|nr:glycoside hydrolase family protein [Candidatus Eremiobacteraceae bacterium]
GKERDTETGNDDFGARYYSWRFGRWLSADWSAVPVPVPYANLTNPQTLNLYAMVADDPESFADLDGHDSQLNIQQQGGSDDPFGETRSCGLSSPCPGPDSPQARGNQHRAETNAESTAASTQQTAQNTSMTLSQKGLEFIEKNEGYSDKIYKDSAGNDSIGYGHLIKKGEDFSKGITKEKAADLLSQDTKTAVDAVNNKVTAKLTQTKFDALVDFTYNLGGGNLGKSTLLSNINSGKDVVKENFTDWNHAGGKVVEGLTTRRTAEWNLFSKGSYP